MEKLLELREVSKRFPLGAGRQHAALNRVSLTVYRGETLGILGESGCGKSTLARAVMGVYPPSGGEILFRGQPLALNRRQGRKAFARHAQMIFQDPYQSLDPHMTVRDIIAENLEIHELLSREEREKRVYALLEVTGLLKEHAQRYPHEFSGGQRQRVGIARALALEPDFLICDEPISSLDRATRGQIMELLLRLKRDLGLTYLFIAHDVNEVRRISDRIAVMYAGQIVELGTADAVCTSPQHPYTQMLLRSCLPAAPDSAWLARAADVRGELPSPTGLGSGCAFAPRCPHADASCLAQSPSLSPVSPQHLSACPRLSCACRT